MVDKRVSVGRDRVLQDLLSLVARAQAGDGGSRWVVGDPGLGKTTLLQQVVEQREPSVRVVQVAGREGESELAWGVFEQLVGPLVEEGLDDALAAPRRAAIRTTLGLEEGSADDASPLATLVGARDLLLAAAADGGLVVVVDDHHWVDTPSRRALDHLLSRLDRTRIAVILAGRPEGAPSTPVTPLSLGPLGETDAMALLRARDVVDPVARRLVEEMGGGTRCSCTPPQTPSTTINGRAGSRFPRSSRYPPR